MQESKNIDYAKHHTLHCWLVARQGIVSCKLSQAFLLLDSSNFNFVDEERSDIYVCTCMCAYAYVCPFM